MYVAHGHFDTLARRSRGSKPATFRLTSQPRSTSSSHMPPAYIRVCESSLRSRLTWLKCALCMAGVQGLELLPDPIRECISLGRPAADSSLARLASWSSI